MLVYKKKELVEVTKEVRLYEKGDVILLTCHDIHGIFDSMHGAVVLETQKPDSTFVRVRQFTDGRVARWPIAENSKRNFRFIAHLSGIELVF